MRRLLQIVLIIGGICLLVLVEMMGLLRRQPSSAAWMFYKSGTTLIRAHPDGSLAKPLYTADHSIQPYAFNIPQQNWMLLTLNEQNQYGTGDTVFVRLSYDGTDVQELLQVQGGAEIETIAPDGENIIIVSHVATDLYHFNWREGTFNNITQSPNGEEGIPFTSPDSEWVVFEQYDVTNELNLWVLSTDGEQLFRLTTTTSIRNPGIPNFSPDSMWLYIVGGDLIEPTLYRIKITTGEVETLAQLHESSIQMGGQWSPDGRYLPFGIITNPDVLIFDSTTNEVIQVTNSPNTTNIFVTWFRSNDWILFESDRDNDGNREFYRIHPDRTGIQRLTNFKNYTRYLTQSADGDWLIFQADDDRNHPVFYSLNYDQREQYQLTLEEDYPVLETWSLDEKWLYFVGGSNGDRQLYRVQIDGSHRQQITHHEAGGDFLLWSPIIDLQWSMARLALLALVMLFTSITIGFLTRRATKLF